MTPPSTVPKTETVKVFFPMLNVDAHHSFGFSVVFFYQLRVPSESRGHSLTGSRCRLLGFLYTTKIPFSLGVQAPHPDTLLYRRFPTPPLGHPLHITPCHLLRIVALLACVTPPAIPEIKWLIPLFLVRKKVRQLFSYWVTLSHLPFVRFTHFPMSVGLDRSSPNTAISPPPLTRHHKVVWPLAQK